MLPPHHLPQLTLNRINAALNRLRPAIWDDRYPAQVEASEPHPELRPLAEGQKLPLSPLEPGTSWGKLFDQSFRRVTLPRNADDNTWLHWIDQGEATLYVNSKAWFGFNVAHRECRLPAGVSEVWLQSSCIQSAIWHPEAREMKAGSLFEGAFICRRNEEAWAAYHDLKCLFDVAMDQRHRDNPNAPTGLNAVGLQRPVDKYSPVYRLLLRTMDEAVDALETDGLNAFRNVLAKAYEALRVDKTFARCILTGHAHVDLVWIWPERMGELKAVNVFATANRLMTEYPEYRFAYSQPASYEAVQRREPALYQSVHERIQGGQWQATGAMYVESDTLIACGEALARSFMIGQEGFVDINGAPSRLTWLPDVFGYSACLPQIMQQTGVEYFFTTKMTWNAINRFPYSSFLWRGNDGSEILAHVTQDSGYVTYMEVNNVKAPMLANQQADVHEEYLLPTGYGDGGGGPTATMLERARRLDSLPGMPQIEWDHPEAFFDRLNEARNRLPVHQGECYLEYHRGTYTTHSNLKASFRKLERALQTVEAAAAITGKLCDAKYAWKRLVFSQFHDYIPGSSVWDVYLEGLPELDQLAHEQLSAKSGMLNGEGDACVFNPHAVPVRRWLQTSEGESVFVQLPPLSAVSLAEARAEAPTPVTLTKLSANNGLVEMQLNEQGWIDSLVWEGQPVPLRGALGQLMIYPDRAAHFEAWDIDRHVLSMGSVCDAPARIIPLEEAHRCGFAVTRKFGKKSEATVRLLLEAGSPLVHVEVDVDWQETESLLKLILPTQFAATHARFGIPFGSVLRPQTPNGLVSEAMWEVPFSRYLAVFDESERDGMFVVSEAKYGASVRDGVVGVSLVRSPRVTGFEAHGGSWPRLLTRLENLSTYSDLGAHSIRLALGRYNVALPRERQPASLADTLFTEPMLYQGAATPRAIEALTGGDTLVPCWAQPVSEGAFVLRLHEVAGRRGVMQLQLADGWRASVTNLSRTEPKPIESGAVAFKPYQVLSVLIERS